MSGVVLECMCNNSFIRNKHIKLSKEFLINKQTQVKNKMLDIDNKILIATIVGSVLLVLLIVPIHDDQFTTQTATVISVTKGVNNSGWSVYEVNTDIGSREILVDKTTVISDGKMQLEILKNGFTNVYGMRLNYDVGNRILHINTTSIT